MALAKKCDICEKLYEVYNTRCNKKKPSGIMLLNVSADGSYFESDVIDCCPECMNVIINIIENLKPIEKREVKNEDE